jgi:uncharacterized protein (DUF433 family)
VSPHVSQGTWGTRKRWRHRTCPAWRSNGSASITRITGGAPCIRGTRIPVATVVGMVAEGMSTEEILADFSQLTANDIAEALRFAAAAVDERTLPLTPSP